jgi:WD40 repeat protein
MSRPLPNAAQQFYNTSGVLLAGGKLYSYAAGTLTPQSTYTDETASTPNPNPTILDSKGHASIWITNAGYKFQLQDSLGNIIWTIDNVYLIEPGVVGSTQIAAGAVGTAQLAANPIGTSQIALGAITSALLAAGSVTTAKITAGSVIFSKLSPTIDMSGLNNVAEVVFKRFDDLSGQKITATPQYPWVFPILQSNPLTLPASAGNDVKWSPDARFLAVGHSTTPFVTIYERSGTTLTKLANPSTLPAASVNGLAWSPCGNFLSCAHTTTPFVTVYQRQGLNFTKLSDPSTLPFNDGNSCAFSPNGEFLAVQGRTVVPVGAVTMIYQIQGTTLTAITSVGGASFVTWSPDSQYLATGTQLTNDINIYQRQGTNFTQVTGPATPSIFPVAASWSPDGQFLALAMATTPFISVYQFSAGTFTLLTDPVTIPTGQGAGIAWSPDGQLLAISFQASPFVMVYSLSGTILTAQSNPGFLPAGNGNGISWAPTTQFLSIAVASTPFVNTYMTDGIFPARATLYSREFLDV